MLNGRSTEESPGATKSRESSITPRFAETTVPSEGLFSVKLLTTIAASRIVGGQFQMNSKVFAIVLVIATLSEERYHYAATGNIPTRMIPVTFGVRW